MQASAERHWVTRGYDKAIGYRQENECVVQGGENEGCDTIFFRECNVTARRERYLSCEYNCR